MEASIALVIGLLIGGGLVAFAYAGRLRDAAAELARREAELAVLREKESALAVRGAQLLAELEKEKALFAERQAAWEAARANLGDAFGKWADPLGLAAVDTSNQAAVAEKQKVSSGTFGAMASRFDGAAGAFAYLLFILLYFPCNAATAAIFQESGARWSAFVVLWATGLGYGLATTYYQAANFARDPGMATLWIGAVAAAFIAAFLALRRAGVRETVLPLVAAQKA